MAHVVSAARRVLLQKEAFLSSLERLGMYTAYGSTCKVVGASIGAHVRHSLDHYDRLLDTILKGEPSAMVRYDVRERGSDVETDLNAGLDAVIACSIKMSKITPKELELPLRVEFNLTNEADSAQAFESCALRELWFVAHHSIHHQAMMKLIAHCHEDTEQLAKALPKEFGVAPATIIHNDACAGDADVGAPEERDSDFGTLAPRRPRQRGGASKQATRMLREDQAEAGAQGDAGREQQHKQGKKQSKMVTKVVVLGGGYAGTATAQALDKAGGVEITLVDRRKGQLHKMGALRSAVDDSWGSKTIVGREKTIKNGRFVQASIEQVSADQVTLDNGESLSFDFLVLATGAQNNSPAEPGTTALSKDAMVQHFAASREAIKKAKNIVIIGGGVVGVELAGEIKSVHRDTDVTIIHSNNEFISSSKPSLGAKFQRKLKKQLDAKGIKYVLGEKANVSREEFGDACFLEGARTITTSSGKEVQADLVFLAVGSTPNTQAFPAEWLNGSGLVQVEPTLQVKGAPKVFALGDIVDVEENKLGYFAAAVQAPLVAKNILALKKNPGAKLKKYKAHDKPFMMVPLGTLGGVSNIGGMFVAGGFLTKMIKGKNLFLKMSYDLNRAKMPK
ncbi:Apoptosis-inducing factor homolog B [Durusdinium trenchii]|uniref:Apoptosis-inducing factor homolog B n=1 Tax=Durusdinium trenchii TaxID=1381693 RepID=A0ABP0JB74_9DINO